MIPQMSKSLVCYKAFICLYTWTNDSHVDLKGLINVFKTTHYTLFMLSCWPTLPAYAKKKKTLKIKPAYNYITKCYSVL